MQRPCQDIMPRTLTRQTKTNDVKLKQMRSLVGFALRYFARNVKLTAAASSFLKSPIFFLFILLFIKNAELKVMDKKWLGRNY